MLHDASMVTVFCLRASAIRCDKLDFTTSRVVYDDDGAEYELESVNEDEVVHELELSMLVEERPALERV